MKRILIVDDHPVMRYGLCQLIGAEEDLEVCCEAGSAGEAMLEIEAAAPDLAIIDISLPDKSGLELIKDIKARHPEVVMLVISSHDEMLYAKRSLRAGALGYVMKEEAPGKLVGAIRGVLDGRVFVSDRLAADVLKGFSGRGERAAGSPLDALTDREFEVFQLIGEGKGTREIANQLNVSVSTIDAHRAHIKKKLKLASGPALVRQAVRWVEAQKLN